MTARATYFEAAVAEPRWAWAGVLGVGVLWLLLLKELRVEWTIDPQYSYGWGVPPLLLYLFWKRWQDPPSAQGVQISPLSLIVPVTLLVSVLPLRLVQEANPDWRLISWLLSMVVVSLSLCAVWYRGGWAWVRHFAPAILFILLAVPWPNGLEQTLTQGLMRTVTTVTAEGMNWLGLGASTRGNLITLPNGVVAVSEACSGIRSFQTSCMLAIFVGELFRLPMSRRFLVLVLGILAAIGLNVIRASALTWVCAEQGPEVESIWHDRAGFLMLGLTVAAVWGIGRCGTWGLVPVREAKSSGSSPGRPIPAAVALVGAAWLSAAEAGVQAWYRVHEQNRPAAVAWSLTPPQAGGDFQARTLPDEMQKLLRCDESAAGTWRRQDGSEWTVFFFRWQPGRMSAQLAAGHTPDICLPANGFKQVATTGQTSIPWEQTELRFNTYVFENSGRPYYVFFCLTDDRPGLRADLAGQEKATYLAGLRPAQRLQAVREGRRHTGHQVLEIAMTGYPDQQAAQLALAEALPRLIAAPKAKG